MHFLRLFSHTVFTECPACHTKQIENVAVCFDIHSRAGVQDFEDEILGDEEIEEQKKKEEAAKKVYHKIRSGDTLGGLAVKYGTTVTAICRLNGISSKTTLRIGRSLRVR